MSRLRDLTRARPALRGAGRLVLALAVVGAGLVAGTTAAQAGPSRPAPSHSSGAHPMPSGALADRRCPPSALAVGYSDALDKLTVDGAQVGGLSAVTYDVRRGAYAAIEDHSGSQATRMWFFRDPQRPQVTGTLLLAKADGSPYTGDNFDAEGLAVLPDGQYLVSSENEPSIHVFSRTGRETAQLAVPARFRVSPAGEATSNATLEGLSISPNGRYVYAAMEGALSGDVSTSGDATFHRILVYERSRRGTWQLMRQLSYRAQPGQRISEVAAYGDAGLVVMEASFDPAVGNAVALWVVRDVRHGPDVSRVANLSAAPSTTLPKTEVADVAQCPTLGAKAKQPQPNPLLDNYEGMAISSFPPFGPGPHLASILLISDDNFGATQVTRVLRLAALLP